MSDTSIIKILPDAKVRSDFVPASDYSEEFHRLEMERLWPRVWQIACREEELPSVGSYANYEIGHESILVVRSAPDSIKAFYNVCPHRGRRLRDDARGTLNKFYCNYHAWTFDLDGNVTSIPSEHTWEGCPQFSRDDLALSSIKVDTWAGWVWINMDPDCEPLHEYLAPLPEKLDVFEWDQCRIRSYQTIIFPVNWKVAIEAFVEAYHVIGTHKQLLRWGHGAPAPVDAGTRHGAHSGSRDYNFDGSQEFTDPRKYLYTTIENTYRQLHGLYHDEGLKAAERVLNELPEGVTLKEAQAALFKFRREEMIKAGAKYPDGVTPDHLRAIEWYIFPNSSVLTTVEGAFWYRSRPNGDDP
ncbi:MAG TPA: Rieske 2Fe-2S domain-containing protein, partial [Spongiibacteraceae bacterium]|nr:Rieske 2Fe-2S domain-containing protein [Spongiibacteraceae bacterium]